ncbi:MAG: type II secretion system protein GspK, partial [Myxococcota bacterium]
MKADRVLRPRRRQRGVALVMVLITIVVLTVFLVEVQQTASTSFAASVAERDRLKAEYNARSAVNLTRLLIAMEPTLRQPIAAVLSGLGGGGSIEQIPVWAFVDQVLAPYNCRAASEGSNSILGGLDLSNAENLGLDDDQGCFEILVVDEDSKINVNLSPGFNLALKQQLAGQLLGLMSPVEYDPLFSESDAEGQFNDRQAICRAVIDWSDYDQDREPCELNAQGTNRGTEDNFYQQLGRDYVRK